MLTVRVLPAHPSPAHLRNPQPPRERGAAHDVLRGWGGPARGGRLFLEHMEEKGREKIQNPK